MQESVTVSTKIPKQLKEKIQRLKIKPSKILRKALEDEVKKREVEELKEEINKLKPVLEQVSMEDIVKSIREDRDNRWSSSFDALAIFRAIKENKIEVLTENYTLELARYELGNIVWKDYALQAKISEQELKMIAKTIKRTLSIMDIIDAAGSEEEILETAAQLTITFYDASYAYFARAKNPQLITEDKRLIKKTTSRINASTLDNL